MEYIAYNPWMPINFPKIGSLVRFLLPKIITLEFTCSRWSGEGFSE